jgi:hypothetical protein
MTLLCKIGTAGGRQAYSRQTHHFSCPVTSTTRCSANCYAHQINSCFCNMSRLPLFISLFHPLYFIPCISFRFVRSVCAFLRVVSVPSVFFACSFLLLRVLYFPAFFFYFQLCFFFVSLSLFGNRWFNFLF